MNRVKNEKILKVQKKNTMLLVVGIVLIILSFVLFGLGTSMDEKDGENVQSLNDII